MKEKSTKKVILDLRRKFGIKKRNKFVQIDDCLEGFGVFIIPDTKFKIKESKTIIKKYFEKVEITDGKYHRLRRNPHCFSFKISSYESEKKKRQKTKKRRKEIRTVRQRLKREKNKKNKLQKVERKEKKSVQNNSPKLGV